MPMPTPEMKEQSDADQKASTKAEKKTYVPAQLKSEPKEDLPDTDKAFDEEKNQKREFKEQEEQLRLEKENYKIDGELSVDDKLKNGWIKVENPAYINGAKKNITVLKKQVDGEEKDAFVREYIDDESMPNMPKHLVGEQMFNRSAIVNLGLEKKLLTYKQMEAVRGGQPKHGEFIKNNFKKNHENLFPGFRDPNSKEFKSVGKAAVYWLLDGDINISNNKMGPIPKSNGYGFSLRFLKQE